MSSENKGFEKKILETAKSILNTSIYVTKTRLLPVKNSRVCRSFLRKRF